MKHWKKILTVAALIGLIFCGVKVYQTLQIFSTPNTAFNNEEAFVYIPTGAVKKDIKSEMEPLLLDLNSFYKVAARLKYFDQIKPGKYLISKGMNNTDIVKVLKGKGEMVAIDLSENQQGNDFTNAAAQISTQIEATKEALQSIMSDTLYLKEKGYKISDMARIYADTFNVPWNTSAEEFRTIVYKRYAQKK